MTSRLHTVRSALGRILRPVPEKIRFGTDEYTPETMIYVPLPPYSIVPFPEQSVNAV